MAECRCHEPEALARAIVGVRIGAVPITWAEALVLARHIIVQMHGKGK